MLVCGMRRKTPLQSDALDEAAYYVSLALKALKAAAEPGMALRLSSLNQDLGIKRIAAEYAERAS